MVDASQFLSSSSSSEVRDGSVAGTVVVVVVVQSSTWVTVRRLVWMVCVSAGGVGIEIVPVAVSISGQPQL